MGLYNGSNETIRKLVNDTWVLAAGMNLPNGWEIVIAGLSAARDLVDDESDKAEIQELIELGYQNIRELKTGVDEDEIQNCYQEYQK